MLRGFARELVKFAQLSLPFEQKVLGKLPGTLLAPVQPGCSVRALPVNTQPSSGATLETNPHAGSASDTVPRTLENLSFEQTQKEVTQVRTNEHAISRWKIAISYLFPLVLIVLASGTLTSAQKQTSKVNKFSSPSAETQPLYKEYRGVRLGMTMQEVRAKLAEPTFKDDTLDFYVISENETTQIAYNAAHKVKVISTDYVGGVGAPDYQSVVGTELSRRPDGSLYQMVTYDKEGFWVSYNKSANGTVTVTIQVLL